MIFLHGSVFFSTRINFVLQKKKKKKKRKCLENKFIKYLTGASWAFSATSGFTLREVNMNNVTKNLKIQSVLSFHGYSANIHPDRLQVEGCAVLGYW